MTPAAKPGDEYIDEPVASGSISVSFLSNKVKKETGDERHALLLSIFAAATLSLPDWRFHVGGPIRQATGRADGCD